MNTCCVCNRSRTIFKRIEITDEDRKALVKMTSEPIPDGYDYCQACWSIVSDRSQGAQLLRGLLHVGLQNVGVRDPGSFANRYYDFFLRKTKSKP